MKSIISRMDQAERKASAYLDGDGAIFCKCPEAPVFIIHPVAVDPDSEQWKYVFKDDPEELERKRKEFQKVQRYILPESEKQRAIWEATAKDGEFCPDCGKRIKRGKIIRAVYLTYKAPEEWETGENEY